MSTCAAITITASNYNTSLTPTPLPADSHSYFNDEKYITNRTGWNNIISNANQINTTQLTNFTRNLLSDARATALTTEAANSTSQPVYGTKAKELRDSIKEEYCYYYSRYSWALRTILTAATQSGGSIAAYRENTITLNKKLNTILAVLDEIVKQRTTSINEYTASTGGLNSLNNELSQARTRLRDDSEKLEKQDLAADIQSSMIDYSLEKNESSRNMLAIYGFMNIVAVGMLFYLYTNVK